MVTFDCKLQKKVGEQDTLHAPPIILWGSCCYSCLLSVPTPMLVYVHHATYVMYDVFMFMYILSAL